MAYDYTGLAATADRLIEKFGQAATIRRKTTTGGSAYDPTSGTTTTTDQAVNAAITRYRNSEIDGTLIKRGDKQALVPAVGLTITPTVKDQFVLGDVVHAIQAVDEVSPGGTVVVYRLQVRA